MSSIGSTEKARAEPWRPNFNGRALAFDGTAAVLAVALAIVVSQAPMGAGDYGQWLMVSRYYSGDGVPGYRDLTAVPPLIPVLLALIRGPVTDPFDALTVLRSGLVAATLLAFYAAGASLFDSRPAGLFAALFALLLTDRFLELFAFGGLLQAGALAFLLLMMADFGRLARAKDAAEERRWWTLAAAAFGLVVLSHTGTVAVAAPVALLCGGFLLARDFKRRPPAAWVRVLLPAACLGGLAALYWLAILAPANSGYGSNPASLAYRGPDRMAADLTSSALTVLLLVMGSLALGLGLGRAIGRRAFVPGAVLTAAWTAASWGVVAATIASDAATDYPRFTPLLLAPLTVAAGALAASCVGAAARLILRRWPEVTPVHSAFGAAAVLLLFLGPSRVSAFEQQASGYRMSDREGLTAVAGWLDANLDEQEAVLVLDSRDGKWIEGLSGSPALFSNPVRYSFRSYEWERQVAAEALARSTLSLVSGEAFVMFTGRAKSPSAEVPRNLLLAFNHDGEFVDMLQLPEAGARVLSGDGEGGTLATLGALEAYSYSSRHEGGTLTVRTEWRGERRDTAVTYVRTVILDGATGAVDVIDEVTTDAPVAGMEVLAMAPGWSPMVDAAAVGPIAEVVFPNSGSRNPAVLIRVEGGVMRVTAEGLVASVPGTRIHLRFKGLTSGAPISELQLLTPDALMERYGIGAIVLKEGASLEARLERLLALGLCREFQAGTYVVLGRRCMDETNFRLPLLASDESPPEGR